MVQSGALQKGSIKGLIHHLAAWARCANAYSNAVLMLRGPEIAWKNAGHGTMLRRDSTTNILHEAHKKTRRFSAPGALVGNTGFEPVTPALSRRCSKPTELIARGRQMYEQSQKCATPPKPIAKIFVRLKSMMEKLLDSGSDSLETPPSLGRSVWSSRPCRISSGWSMNCSK